MDILLVICTIILWYILLLRANTPLRPHPSGLGKINKGIREYKSPTPVKLLHSLKIFNKGLIPPPGLNFYIRWRSSLMMMMVVVVERTRTGPSAARSDLEHQVNHNAKISIVYHVFSSYEEGGPTGTGKTRCLAVLLLLLLLLYYYTIILILLGSIVTIS